MLARRVHVPVWHIPGPKRGSDIPTLVPAYISWTLWVGIRRKAARIHNKLPASERQASRDPAADPQQRVGVSYIANTWTPPQNRCIKSYSQPSTCTKAIWLTLWEVTMDSGPRASGLQGRNAEIEGIYPRP